jgi:hypothetical protein
VNGLAVSEKKLMSCWMACFPSAILPRSKFELVFECFRIVFIRYTRATAHTHR